MNHKQNWQNTAKLYTLICEICKKPFTFKGLSANKKTCSKECFIIKHKRYIKTRRESEFNLSIRFLLYGIRNRAKNNGYISDVTFIDLEKLFKNQNGKCKKTNIPFELNKGIGTKERSPWSISIDRIDNSKGYTKDNVQLVCLMYNLCKSSWTEKEVQEFCR